MPSVVLASRSPQRREILGRLGLDFSVRVSEAPELEVGEPAAVALENALRKARAVARPGEDELVIGCDTIVVADGRIFGKPADERAAEETIRALAGRTQHVISGLAVLVGGRGAHRPREHGRDVPSRRARSRWRPTWPRGSGANARAATRSRGRARGSWRGSTAKSRTSWGFR